MNFKLTDEQKSYVEWGRSFAEKEIRPMAEDLDRNGVFDKGLFAKIAAAGFMQTSVAKEYGGKGDGVFGRSLVAEEFAKECVSTGVNYTIAHGGLCVIKKFGSEAQKKRFIPPMTTGKSISTFAFTEECAGSDAGGAKTTAVLKDGRYVINGKKSFITLAPQADVHVIFAMTEPGTGTKGMSAFIVPAETPGVSVGKVYSKVGMRSVELGEVILDQVSIPEENRIGEEKSGMKYGMQAIDEGKLNVAFLSLGLAERALAESISYMKTREQFGKPIAVNQGLQWYIAEMIIELEAARLLSYKAALAAEEKDPDFGRLAAIAKVHASEMAFKVAGQAMQIHGANGITTDYVIERLYRDAQGLRLYDGTSEIQKLIISRAALR